MLPGDRGDLPDQQTRNGDQPGERQGREPIPEKRSSQVIPANAKLVQGVSVVEMIEDDDSQAEAECCGRRQPVLISLPPPPEIACDERREEDK